MGRRLGSQRAHERRFELRYEARQGMQHEVQREVRHVGADAPCRYGKPFSTVEFEVNAGF
jgi:hypothetical protein